MGKIMAVCISEARGTQKHEIEESEIVEGWGLKDDAHGGNWHRQVSLYWRKLRPLIMKSGVISAIWAMKAYQDLGINPGKRLTAIISIFPGLRCWRR